MRLRADWTTHLHDFRKRELEIIFHGCPSAYFDSALELGAGDGFQSRVIVTYAKRLVATEYNDTRLERLSAPGVTYAVCDAERVGEQFAKEEFDLVFASNLFEHLPHPEQALRGIRNILRDDGVVVLVMPSIFWKCTHLAFFYPNLILSFFERVLVPGKIAEWWSRYALRRETRPTPDSSGVVAYGNNPKGRAGKPRRSGRFFPLPHGVSLGNIAELFAFRAERWVVLCETEGFSLCDLRRGPVASGYGFGLDGIRALLERFGFTSEYIYILKKKGVEVVKYPFHRP